MEFNAAQDRHTELALKMDSNRDRIGELRKEIAAVKAAGGNIGALRLQSNALSRKQKQIAKESKSLSTDLYNIDRAIREPARYPRLKQYQFDPANKLRVVATERRLGWWLQLTDTAGRVTPPPEQKLEVFSAFLDAVDEALQKVVYRFFVDGRDQPILPPLVRLELRQMEYIGRDIHGHNKGVRDLLQLRTADAIFERNDGCRINALLIVDNRDTLLTQLLEGYDNRKSDYALWIPKMFPVLFRTADDAQVRYFAEGTHVRQTDVATASSVAVYRFDGDRFESVEARGEPVTFGAGGGAMRSDRVSEVEYAWSGSPALGYALGLDLQRHTDILRLDEAALMGQGFIRAVLPITPGDASVPVYGNMASEIIYYKRFKPLDPNKPLPPQKKNEPRETLPLHFAETRKRRVFTEEHLKSGQVLKKKGAWFYGPLAAQRGGEPLKKGNTDRSSAGAVMRAGFQALGLTAETKDEDLGSATQFANYVVRRDAVARDAWGILSKNATAHPKVDLRPAELEQKKAQIRTDQEWCHLYGHGDGGSEEVGNFISGSKHCNTVQLAIECGQRSRVDDDSQSFTIKVSGYLFPGLGWKKSAFTANDMAYLKQFRWPATVDASAPDFAVRLKGALDQLLGNWSAIDFAALLPDAAQGDHSVPTTSEFRSLSKGDQERIKKNAQERLLGVQREYLPFGALVRYKIYMNQSKIFDFSYSAQQESFDYNEFKILEYTVRRVVAVAQGRRDDYVRSINRKVEMRLAQEEQADQIRQRLGVYALV